MLTEEENDISNILIDGEVLSNSQFIFDLSNEDKPTVKGLKSHLKCVVCGDNAFGKKIKLGFFFFKINLFIL
jgi:hypothetical protein